MRHLVVFLLKLVTLNKARVSAGMLLCLSAFGNASTIDRDVLNRIVSVVFSTGDRIDYVYDAAGNMVEERVNSAVASSVTAQSNPQVGGRTVISPSKPRYLPGESLTLTASPTAGYSFSSWSGVAGCTTNPVCDVTVGSVNIAAIANFTPNPASCSSVSGPTAVPASGGVQSYSATCIDTSAYVWTLNGTSLPACTTSNCDITFPTNALTSTVPFTVQVAPASTPAASASLAVTQAGASVCTSISGLTTVPNLGGSFSWVATCLNTSAYVWTINDQPSSCTTATCQISFVGNGSQSASVYTIKVAPANAPTAIASIVVSQTGVAACNSLTGPTTIGPAAGSQTYSASCANTANYVWTLDGITLAGCTTASCAVSFGANTGTTTVNHTVQVAPADNTSATANLAVAQTGVSTCTAISGPSTVAASGGNQTYSATCANTSMYEWSLDGVTIATCTGATCGIPFAANTSAASVVRSLKVAPSNNVASFATLAITQAGASVCSSLGGPVSVVAGANSQSYTATCANTSTYSWTLDGTAIPACTGATCAVAFPANSATTTVNHTVQVAPSNNLTAAASLAVAQAGASACSAVSGPTSVSASGGSQSYSGTCANTTAYVWSLNGTAISGCTTATCSVSFPVNAATTSVAFAVQVAPSSAPTAIASLAVTQAGASVCTVISGPTTVVAAGGNVTWTATCANTSAYVWTLDNQPTSCTSATCQLAIAANASQTAANHTLKVWPANAATSVASLVFSQPGVSACNSVSGPTTIGAAASIQTYTANCANTSSYVWTLDGVALTACTTSSCAVNFTANAVSTAANHTVQVAPANNAAAAANVAVVQAGASVCTAVSGPTSIAATASSQTYTATCANTTTFAWALNGSALPGCTASTCAISFATNASTTALPFTVAVAPINAPTASVSIAGTQAGASVCTSISGPTSVVAGGASVSLTATCANTTAFVWTLNNQTLNCTGTTCPQTIAANTTPTPITYTFTVAPANAPTMTATLTMTQAGLATCSSLTGPAIVPAAASTQSYSATCVNTSVYVWKLDGVLVPSCTGATCAVPFPERTFLSPKTWEVSVAPSTNLTAVSSKTISQRGVTMCVSVTGPTTVSYAGGPNLYTSVCGNLSTFLWTLDGVPISGCNTYSCSVTFSANPTFASVNHIVQVAPGEAPNASASLAVTQGMAPPQCSALTGPTAIAAIGGPQSYSAVCNGAVGFVWNYNGQTINGCTTATCLVTIPANTTSVPIDGVVQVTATNSSGNGTQMLTVTTAAAAPKAINVSITPAGGGTVTLNQTKASFSYGEVVQLTPTALPGYRFSGWSGYGNCGSLPSNPDVCVISMPLVDVAITANFTACTFTLSPSTITVPYDGASNAVTVTTQAGCAWSLSTTASSWLNVVAPLTGVGTATRTLTSVANTGAGRSGAVLVNGASAGAMIVTQDPVPSCNAVTGSNTVAATGATQSYSASCANTSRYQWSVNGSVISACTAATCDITFASNSGATPLTHTVSVAPALNATAVASLTVAQGTQPPSCSVVSGATTAPSTGGTQNYVATCVGTGSFVWTLNSAPIAGCAAPTCAVTFPDNTTTSLVTFNLVVAPSSAPTAAAALAIAQSPHSPSCTGVANWRLAFGYEGGTSTYSISCSAATTYAWSLNGVPLPCTTATCAVTFPPNYLKTATTYQLGVIASSVIGAAQPAPQSVTVGAAPVCTLDFDGDLAVSEADIVLLQRWLLGFRGEALVSGISTVPVGTGVAAFAAGVTARLSALTTAYDVDGDGRVLAHTDGLMLRRLVLGVTGSGVAHNATGANATRVSYDAIRSHVNGVCGTGFAAATPLGPSPSVTIDTTQAALTAIGAVFPLPETYSFVSGINGRSAVKFNGIVHPGAILIPNSAGMQFSGETTFDLWARIDGATGMSEANGQAVASGWAMALVAKSHDAGSVSINAFANDGNYSGSGYGFAAWASSEPGWGTGTCAITIRNPGAPLGTWFRITAVASLTAGTRVYHNKRLIYSCPNAVPNFTGMNAQDLYIGKYRDSWYPLNGAVQDIRVYQKALTDAEIQDLP